MHHLIGPLIDPRQDTALIPDHHWEDQNRANSYVNENWVFNHFAPPVPVSLGIIVLLVGDSAVLTAGDTYLQSRLGFLGYTVLIRDDSDPEESASNYDGWVASETVSNANVGAKYSTVAKPGVLLDFPLWETHGLTTGIANVSAGNTQWTMQAVAGLDGGLTGVQTIYSVGSDQPSVTIATQLTGGALIPALRTANLARTAYFAYESGVAMPVGNAPARRVAVGHNNAVLAGGIINATGEALLNAAFTWAFPAVVPPDNPTLFFLSYS